MPEEKIPTASSTPTPVVQDTRCYTIEDLMAMLILSRPTVCRLLKQNEFRWFKVGGAYRISKTSFDAWLNDGITNPILLFDILNISSEICYSLAGRKIPANFYIDGGDLHG